MAENEQLKWMLDGICSDSIRSFVLEQQMDEREILNLSEFNAKFLPVKEYAITASAKRRYNEVFAVYANDTLFLGKPAMDISLPDTSGNMVNLNSFKGKVIFIDTWATWCGPCKEQLPFLKELEASYKNDTGIVFAGISIDREKDKEKWKKMIRTENLPGIQLFDDFGKQFRNPMMIESIPRFLLIDKNGNWIEVRCPKPDQKDKLKKMINAALAS
jgi:thiol-disulfide isomerase/thioredoxin